MLPGIDDQNEIMAKKVERVLQKTETIVGTRMFYGAVWLVLLRSPRARIGGLKFIEKHIPRSLEAAQSIKVHPIQSIIEMQAGHI